MRREGNDFSPVRLSCLQVEGSHVVTTHDAIVSQISHGTPPPPHPFRHIHLETAFPDHYNFVHYAVHKSISKRAVGFRLKGLFVQTVVVWKLFSLRERTRLV